MAKTDAEWHEFCRPFVFLNGSHEFPNYSAICRAVWQASRQQMAEEAVEAVICELIAGNDLIDDDETYNLALVHAADAIRSLAAPTEGNPA